jgi:hypothetical protein
MRRAAALVTLGAMGVLAGTALAQTPTVPIPTVTVPSPPPLPAPLPTVPTLPAPTPPAPALPQPAPSLPSVGTPSPSTPSSSTSAPSTSATSTASGALPGVTGSKASHPSQSSAGQSSSQSSSSGATGSSSSGTARRPRVKQFESSRTWIGTSGERARRVTTLTFVLPHAARVFFTVTQVSPDCHVVGRFSFRGKAGLNRVRFAGHVGKRQLGAGTYLIAARTRGGSTVERLLLVVVAGGAPDRSELAAARASNACPAAARETASATATAGPSGSGFLGAPSEQIASPLTQGQPRASAPEIPTPDAPLGGVLASSIEETANAIRPILIVLLAASILLLGLASVPRVALADARFNELLARHRLEIAGIGTAALIAFAITFLVA